MNTNGQENLIRLYLLGALAEEKSLALEQEYFADAEKFEQVWAIENELVDAYVREQLPAQERTLFERNYLASPKHRERVAAAQLLLQAADATLAEEPQKAPPKMPAHVPWWKNFSALFRTPQFAWGGALAMLLLLAGWLYWRVQKSSSEEIAGAQPSPSVLSSATPVPTPSTSTSVTPTPQPTASVRPSSPATSPSSRTNVPAVLAFALLGAGVRDSGNVQQLVIPSGTKQVRLQMKLEDENFSRYQVKLRKIEGAEIFSQSSLSPAPNQKSVAILIPTTKLSPGDYVLTLSGLSQSNDPEEINKYFFRVSKK